AWQHLSVLDCWLLSLRRAALRFLCPRLPGHQSGCRRAAGSKILTFYGVAVVDPSELPAAQGRGPSECASLFVFSRNGVGNAISHLDDGLLVESRARPFSPAPSA